MKRFLLLAATALVSLVWIAFAAPQWHPASRLRLALSREAYIAKARRIAAENGFPLDNYAAVTKLNTNSKQQEIRLLLPNDPVAQTYPEASVSIKFPDNQSVSVLLRPEGTPIEWKLPAAAKSRQSDTFATASAAMRTIAGADAAQFVPTGTPSISSDESTYVWRRSNPATNNEVSIEVIVKNGYARSSVATFHVADNASGKSDALSIFRFSAGFLWFACLLFVYVYPLLKEGGSAITRSLKDRAGLRLSLIAALATGIGSVLEWDAASVTSPDASATALEIIGVVIGMVVLGMMVYAVCAVTFLNARFHVAQVRGFRLLATRAFLSRIVGAEIAAGMLAGPVLLGIPLAVAAVLRSPVFKIYDEGNFLNPYPVLDAISNLISQNNIAVLAMLGIMIPFAARYTTRKRIRVVILVLAVFLTLVTLSLPFHFSILANAVDVLITGTAVYFFYKQFGVLGVLTGWTASGLLSKAVSLLLQPSSSLRTSGTEMVLLYAVALLAAAIVAWKGTDVVSELYGESIGPAESRSRREEILAGFSVARTAQQKMLPSRMPVLSGYSISASCDPAREVGGDLYDFLPLRDGRIGIGVADVSGKGVPAALYMTLTKGLLCAASQDSDDPRAILGVVNTHLREVAKKKMFVTMALGVLDPASGSVEYARAGHNPVVWRRRRTGETRMLAGAGIGLGIAAPTLFTRTLAVQKLQLGPGDALVFYSDGLTEAMNETLEQFGDDRLMAAVERTDGMPAMEARDSILKEVKRFLNGIHPQDDLTIAVLRVNEV